MLGDEKVASQHLDTLSVSVPFVLSLSFAPNKSYDLENTMTPEDFDANIIISLPLPNIGIEEAKFASANNAFDLSEERLFIRAVYPHPISESWVEIAFNIALFTGGLAIGHYAEKLFDVLDSTVVKRVNIFNCVLCRKNSSEVVDIPRDNREEAIRLLTEALEKLKDHTE